MYCIIPDIKGVPCFYDSNKQKVYCQYGETNVSLGAKTYLPIYGYLYVQKSTIEKFNYSRAKENLPFIKTSEEIIHYAFENGYKGLSKILNFYAIGMKDENNRIILEDNLLKKLGYALFPQATAPTKEEVLNVYNVLCAHQKEYFSLCKCPLYGVNIIDTDNITLNYRYDLKSDVFTKPILSFNTIMDYTGKISFAYEFAVDNVNCQIKSQFYYKETLPLIIVNGTYHVVKKNTLELTNCPFCESKLLSFDIIKKQHFYCVNAQCREKILQEALHYAGKEHLNINGISYATLHRLYDYRVKNNMLIRCALDLLNLTQEQIHQIGIREKQSDLLYEAIQSKRKQSLSCYIEAFKASSITKENASKLEKLFGNHFIIFTSDLLRNDGRIIRRLVAPEAFDDLFYEKNMLLNFYIFSKFSD